MKLKEKGVKKVIAGSLNVEALYPPIDQTEHPRIVANEVLKSEVQFENINFHLTAVYLGTIMDRTRQIKEGVARLILSRKARSKRGRRRSGK